MPPRSAPRTGKPPEWGQEWNNNEYGYYQSLIARSMKDKVAAKIRETAFLRPYRAVHLENTIRAVQIELDTDTNHEYECQDRVLELYDCTKRFDRQSPELYKYLAEILL